MKKKLFFSIFAVTSLLMLTQSSVEASRYRHGSNTRVQVNVRAPEPQYQTVVYRNSYAAPVYVQPVAYYGQPVYVAVPPQSVYVQEVYVRPAPRPIFSGLSFSWNFFR